MVQKNDAQVFRSYFVDNGINNITISKPKELILSANVPVEQKINIQGGFSPIKFLSFSIAYLNQNTFNTHVEPSVRSRIEFKNSSFTASIGTYYFYDFKRKKKYKRRTSRRTKLKEFIKNKPGIIADLKIGFSRDQLINLKKGINIQASTAQFNYTNAFLQMGIFLRFKYGQIGLNNKFVQINYHKIEVNGTAFNSARVYRFADSLIDRRKAFIYALNLSSQFGTRQMKLLLGMTTNHTFLHENSLNYIDQTVYYIGISLDLNGLKSILKKEY